MPELIERNIPGVPLLDNMPRGHSKNRRFVLVDYANKLSPTLKSVMFAIARSCGPDFLFQILIEEG